LQLLEGHSHGCLQGAIRSGKGMKAVAELMEVVKRFAR
jgi:DNA-binding FrmR family transcriptional regulator